ncbi:hypothetical protein SDJN03_04294, partial [Cucurbita argyrosperma subsp. sororia]
MSWFRAAVIRAVEAGAGGKDNITRTVRNYAGTVVHHAGNAVVEGAKIIQDRIGPRNMQGFKQTVKRLEEISVSSRGVERVQLLRRWLVALKEVDRFSSGSIEGDINSPTDQPNDETKDSPKNPTLVYYVDPDMGGELKTFRDVFLTSQALEGITLSMVLQEILSQVQLYSKLEELLLKKKLFNEVDSPQLHAEKVDKLRILSESLANSTLKAEKRIVDQREQREDALNFRLAKSEEMVQAEKELTYDIRELENQKDKLEAELEKVNTLLSSARMRLHNAREEREHFDEASSQMLVHLKTKEDELFKSVASYKVEATAVNACKNFLENTWDLRISQRQKTEELVELLRPTFLRSDVSPNTDDGSLHVDQQRRKLEEEYLDIESKFVSTLSTVDTVRMQFYETKGVVRNFDEKVQELFDALEKIKQEFESIKRPKLLIETTRQRSELAVNEKSHIDSSSSEQTAEVRRLKFEDINDSLAKGTKNFSLKAEMAKPDSTEEVDTVDSNEEINDWEFDELGRDYDAAASNDQRR